MTSENKKILTLSFIVLGAVAAIVVSSLLSAFSGMWPPLARFYSIEAVRHGIPVGVGIITFFVLQFNKKYLTYADEVVSEIKKVVFPSRRDTTAMTVVVSIMLIISGFVLGFFDIVSNYIVNLMLKTF